MDPMKAANLVKQARINASLVEELRARRRAGGNTRRDLIDAGFIGAGGVTGTSAADILHKQYKFIRDYNPTSVYTGDAPARGLKRGAKSVADVAKSLREGDVIVYGLDDPWRGFAPKGQLGWKDKIMQRAYQAVSGGMGGFDEHSTLVHRIPGSRGKLQAIYPAGLVKGPKARRTPSIAAANRFFEKLFGKSWWPSPLHAVEQARLRNARFDASYMKPLPEKSWKTGRPNPRAGRPDMRRLPKGSMTELQLDSALRNRTEYFGEKFTRDIEPYIKGQFIDKERPFTVFRQTGKYDREAVERALRKIGNTSFSELEVIAAALQRRALPKRGTDVVEAIRNAIWPKASTQGANCAGGICRVSLGKGVYNIPSDIRYMKEFEKVEDFLPESLLKAKSGHPHSGSNAAKTLENIKNYMRRGARRTGGLGILAGLGLAGWGAHGIASRTRPGRLNLKELLAR